jgi:hypothetical protein
MMSGGITNSLPMISVVLEWGGVGAFIVVLAMIVRYMFRLRALAPEKFGEIALANVLSFRWPAATAFLCEGLFQFTQLQSFEAWSVLAGTVLFYLGVVLAFPLRPGWVSWPFRAFGNWMVLKSPTYQKGG